MLPQIFIPPVSNTALGEIIEQVKKLTIASRERTYVRMRVRV